MTRQPEKQKTWHDNLRNKKHDDDGGEVAVASGEDKDDDDGDDNGGGGNDNGDYDDEWWEMKTSRFWRLRTRNLVANSRVLVATWYVLHL